MRKLGIAIYPEISGINKTKKYIENAHRHGFSRIFINLLEVNKDDTSKIDELKEVAKFATKLKFEVIIDVNPSVYKELSLPNTEIDFFADLGVSGIRLDTDFGGTVESELSKNTRGLLIELNASTGTRTLDKALKLGGNPTNLIACHNFYPMEYTALHRERFIELSSHYKSKGIRTSAFITLPKGQKNIFGPWNVNDGMPTLESHRTIPLKEQVLDLLNTGLIDDIIISSQGATESQFMEIKDAFNIFDNLQKESVIEIGVEFKDNIGETEKKISLEFYPHQNRDDYNAHFVRSTMPRLTFASEEIFKNNTQPFIYPGDVTILNNSMGRYKGELHINKIKFEDKDRTRNVIGKVIKKDNYKLDFIKSGKSFIIKEINYEK